MEPSRFVALAITILLAGCLLQTAGLGSSDSDGDVDGDTDGDTDGDIDADADAHAAGDADADLRPDGDGDSGTVEDADRPGDADIGPWLDPYPARKSVSVSGPPLTAPLTPFVVAIIIGGDGDLARMAREEGYIDLAFTAADATTRLEHETESFDRAGGTLVAWVRLLELPPSGHTELFMYYRPASEAIRRDTAPTWTGICAGVWHLADACDADRVRDSSANANHGTTEEPGRPTCEPGRVGRGRSFDGDDDVITIGDPADDSLDFGMRSFSYSVWVHVTRSVDRWDMPWYKGGASAGNPGYDFELGSSAWTVSSSDGSGVVWGSFGDEIGFRGRWVHLVAAFDRAASRLRMYADGVRVQEIDISSFGSMSNSTSATLGSERYPFRGTLDEVRVYSFAVSDDWVAAVYANLNSPETFLTVAAEVTRP